MLATLALYSSTQPHSIQQIALRYAESKAREAQQTSGVRKRDMGKISVREKTAAEEKNDNYKADSSSNGAKKALTGHYEEVERKEKRTGK